MPTEEPAQTSSTKPDFTMEEEIPEPVHRDLPKREEPPKKQPEPPKKQPEVVVPEHERVKNEGNYHYKEKNFAKALECYNKAIELHPSEVLYYNNKAAVYIETKDYTNALAAVDAALQAAEEHSVKDFVKIAKIYARKASIL